MTSFLIFIHRFETIFHWHFNTTFIKDNEHLWHFTSEGTANFHVPIFNHEDLKPCNVKCTGSHPKMLLYTLNELFDVFRGIGAKDLNRHQVVANEILSFMSLCCMERWGKPKKCCNTHGEASVRMDLNDTDGLECLTWAIYDGVFLPMDPPMLTRYHDSTSPQTLPSMHSHVTQY